MLSSHFADSQGMFTNALHLLKENQDCLEILRAYAVREKLPGGEPEVNWSKRLSDQIDLADDNEPETDKSSESHGLLIAYGYLDIELAGRGDGIHYRLSGDGKRALMLMDEREKEEPASDEQRLAG